MDNRVYVGAALATVGLFAVAFIRSQNTKEATETYTKTISTIHTAQEKQSFQKLYTILISGKRYSGKQTVAECLRKQFSVMNQNSRVFSRANVLGGPPIAGNYKTKNEIIDIYRRGMASSSLFYADKTLDMLYDRHSPQDKLVLIISDIRNADEIKFWKERSQVFRTVYVDTPDDDRRERGWNGDEDEYNFVNGYKWDFILKNGTGNDVQKMTTRLFINSLLPSVEGRAEISVITKSTLYSKFLHDYAYMLATAVQSELGKVSSVNVNQLDPKAVAIGAPLACILQVPLSFESRSHSDVYVTTMDTDYEGPRITIDSSVCSYQIYT